MTATSDLYVAQPITFETMRLAREYAHGTVDVRLLTTQYPEDHDIIPEDFQAVPDLERSVLDLGEFERPRKLPILADILDRLYESASDAEYVIYTNVDIALMPHFYLAVARLIDQGYDAFVINRRTISSEYDSVDQLPLMYMQAGEKHPGHDCFVFRRDAYPDFELGLVCVGVNWVGRALILNLAATATKFEEFKDAHLTFHIGSDTAWKNTIYADCRAHNFKEASAVVERLSSTFGPLEDKPHVREYLVGLRPRRATSKSPWYWQRIKRALRGILRL